jgi:hypothetical protein
MPLPEIPSPALPALAVEQSQQPAEEHWGTRGVDGSFGRLVVIVMTV